MASNGDSIRARYCILIGGGEGGGGGTSSNINIISQMRRSLFVRWRLRR